MTSLRKVVLLTIFAGSAFSVAAAVDSSLETSFDRFESTQIQSLVEDMWAHQRRLVRARFSAEQAKNTTIEDPAVRVEWYLRLGPARSPIGLDELTAVRDPKLLDEVLWSLVNEAVMGNLLEASNDWQSIQETIGSFLETHPLRRALLETSRGAWWAWIQDLPFKGETPWQLGTLQQLLRARTISDPLASLQAYCVATVKIPSDQRLAGLHVARELRSRLPIEIMKQRQLLREVFARKVSCSRLFTDLAEIYEERRNYELASEQRSYALLQKMEGGVALNSSELRDVAHYSYEAGDWKNAYEFYSRARTEGANDVDIKARQLLAGIRSSQVAYQDTESASEIFETVLQESFQSIYRDEVLLAYANFLESRSKIQSALEVWRWNYQYASKKEQRLEGLEKAVIIEGRSLDSSRFEKPPKAELLSWLNSMNTLKRFEASSPVFLREKALALNRVKRAGLSENLEVRATLKEIIKDAEGVR